VTDVCGNINLLPLSVARFWRKASASSLPKVVALRRALLDLVQMCEDGEQPAITCVIHLGPTILQSTVTIE
jgi:hypothetical protein